MKIFHNVENWLVSLGLLAVTLAAMFFLLNAAKKYAPAPVSTAANTLGEYASGSAFGF